MGILRRLFGPSSLDHYHKGIEYGSHGEYDAAEMEFVASVRMNPDDISSQEAVALARDSRSGIIPNETALHLFRGAKLANQGARAEALREFEAALSLSPHYGRAYAGVAMVHIVDGRGEEAARWFQRAVAADPGNPNIHYGLGTYYAEAGEYRAAVREFEIALRIQPSLNWAGRNLRECRRRLGEEDAS